MVIEEDAAGFVSFFPVESGVQWVRNGENGEKEERRLAAWFVTEKNGRGRGKVVSSAAGATMTFTGEEEDEEGDAARSCGKRRERGKRGEREKGCGKDLEEVPAIAGNNRGVEEDEEEEAGEKGRRG
ncbi:hypothetical protein HAX54_014750 [Datura stramonium]|uniref:Uncharacterized protein n=1 Tax=Datura stramonium TaxID=4076 RepID=A0ABS8TRM5_DATST|nr:hypothetical protein [Datura stramonium]